MKYKLFASHFLLWLIVGCCIFAFTSDAGRSQYVIPLSANVITSTDLDLDGDMDIVSGHVYNWFSHWSGISILNNIDGGQFGLLDSVFFGNGIKTLMCGQLDDVENPEIIFHEWVSQQMIGIIYNNNIADTFFIPVNSNKNIDFMDLGDIDGDGLTDIILCSNLGKYWKILYNHGYKYFTFSPFYYIYDYYPVDIACGDLDNDGRDDVVICGQYVDVYKSTSAGFEKIYRDPDGIKNKLVINDFNCDGWNDIIASADLLNTEWINIYQNTGGNSFNKLENFFLNPGASEISVTDFNNDTLPDIAYLMYTSFGDTSGIKITYNLGNFQVSEPQHVDVPNLGENLRSFHSADLDGNGYNDFAVVRFVSYPLQNLELLFNDGYGHFGPDPVVDIAKHPKIKQQLCCYPNPFREHITFDYEIDKTALVELVIYNLQGKLIKQVINQKQKGGHYSISWKSSLEDNVQHKTNVFIACLRVNGKIYQSVKLLNS
jgi:hypothetical protein